MFLNIFEMTFRSMRIINFLIFLSPLLVFTQARNSEQLLEDGMKKYDKERLKITYELSGDAEGAEIMVFENFGWQSMRKQTMIFELYGIKTIQTLFEITDGDFVYRLNEGDSTMTKKSDYKWSQQAAYKEPQDVSEAILFSMGGTYSSDSTLLEKKCEVWTFKNKALVELWVWDGIVLRRKTKLGDQLVYATATEIESDFVLGENFFQIPDYMKEKE